jgi:excisionase family DNA binding protein
MNALLEKTETVVPTEHEVRQAAESSRILARIGSGDGLRVHLDDGQVLTLPRAAARLLSHLLTEMSLGHAVTLMPVHAELTTREAADILNVSRPHLVKLLETGAIPFHKVGTHRRVRFEHLHAYREQVLAEQEKALDELAAQAQDLGMGY